MKCSLRPLLLGLALLLPQAVFAQETVQAKRTAASISLDGRLDEEAWHAAIPCSGFLQRDPQEGAPASEDTEVRFLYNDNALYIGIALYDRSPSEVAVRTARRDDQQDGDYFQLYLDPYHDRRTGALFQVNAAGSLRDLNISNDTNTDSSWDAVWDAAVSRNETGWFAEIEIPFSQLRFREGSIQTWGVNMARFIFRKNETSWFQLVPKSNYGLASRFADLTGIEGVHAGRNLELLPYLRGGVKAYPAVASDPYSDGRNFSTGSGLDMKYGLRSNLTLDATINPDFGQVEADPAVVNLSAFETFFQEKRPFFIEGSQIFSNFGKLGGVCCGVVSPTYFYSRRIGRSPKGSADGDFVSKPDAATIAGAGKLTGRLGDNWTVGFLNATTSSEFAKVITNGREASIKVEPASNYSVGRVLREFERGGLGVLGTAVRHWADTADLRSVMPTSSRMLGADGYYYLGADRTWSVNGRMTGAWNSGSAEEIDRLQRAPQRYLHRPDAVHLHYDPTATQMKGWAGGANAGKISGGFTVSASLSANSPGYDVNDAGFQGSSDLWGSTFSMNWRQNNPDRFTRNRNVFIYRSDGWNFNREIKQRFTQITTGLTFLNYWNISSDIFLNEQVIDDRLTRGGPLSLTTPDTNFFVHIGSDSRKRFNFRLNNGYGQSRLGNWFVDENVDVGIKPSSSITLTVSPSLNRSYSFSQYVTTQEDATAAGTFGSRYIFADLDRSAVGMTTRMNWSMTPKISLQIYQQLLLSSGEYWGFKELSGPRTLNFSKYGVDRGAIEKNPTSSEYTVDPDGAAAAPPLSFSDPSFNFKSLITNAVFRWEWKPGSTLFLVWQQTKSDSDNPGPISAGRDLHSLFGAPSTNILLMKVTYWFNR